MMKIDTFKSPNLAGDVFAVPGEAPHERVHWFHDAVSGMQAIVAIHSTARGPAFGGCRMWPYERAQDALVDALRLSHGMSLKNALADLPFGGGKAVILKSAAEVDRAVLLRAFGACVKSLEGQYITAEDVGTTTDDMHAVQKVTRYVSGIPREDGFGGDPSPMTARGVFVSIREAMRVRFGRDNLQGVRIAVQGLGAVGGSLSRMLHEAGASLWVADTDPRRTKAARDAFDAVIVDPQDIVASDVDVFAPCALGGVMDAHAIARLRAPLVAGAANNQLATAEDGELLHARGILYLPDFLVNAGGIISVAREYLGTGTHEAVLGEVDLIGSRVVELLDRSAAEGISPQAAAHKWAQEKLAMRV